MDRKATSTGARIFAGGLATETNSFSPIPTGYDDFRKAHGTEHDAVRDAIFFGGSFRAYRTVTAARMGNLLLGSYCFATPAGPPSRAVYGRLRDELLTELAAVMPVQGVLLTLHGAMVCDGIDDCETDIVRHVRDTVGPAAVIGVLLDLHCDLPPELVEAADVIVVVKEYPHIDVEPCGRRLAELVLDAVAGRIQPTMGWFDCRMVGLYPTVREPVRSFVDDVLCAAENEPGVLVASLGHGFPFLDALHPGARALVVSDGDEELAKRVAANVGQAFHTLRREAAIPAVPLATALAQVDALPVGWGPIVLADIADNAGGGAPSDSTFILGELLRQERNDAALAPLWDPVAVQHAFAAGVGATLALRLGGKTGPGSGPPLDVRARVCGLVRDLTQRWPQTTGFAELPLGDAAWLEIDGVDVIAVSRRDQAFGIELFTAFGIDPASRRLLVLKSANHFRAAFDPLAADVIYVDAGGSLPADPRDVPYTRFDRNAFPWLLNPLDNSA